MRIRAGYELIYECPQPTPMLLALNIHPSRRADLLTEQRLTFTPPVEARDYVDGFGNVCTRIVAPAGVTTIATDFEIYDHGRPDPVVPDAVQHDIRDLPDEVLVFLLGSRYCDTDRLGDFAWAQFGQIAPGWAASRRSATSCTATSPSTTRTPIRCAPPMAASPTAPASAATSRIWRSRCAVR